ncbi:YceI family protein [Shewanella sp. D64]|uniref:YceI family protein n=1 Tax=unclassified Shewanella TaxID=196818 RepID=UPI0022BA1D48|nr:MULTISPECIES: YceI family protein [unclassified Shewanella]MEC4725020.1 YceI family protein [Shewanella sp. D64]MEC4736921.1 YceI family protein [Shewanella sp. E94]WBJ96516.1 YceI family protein [Shewanella sp. MTB7]
MKSTFAVLMLSIASCIPMNATAQWSLAPSSAELNFLSTKVLMNMNSITEISRFQTLSGTVSDDGELTLKVKLGSVDTQVPIRDQRLRDWVFEVSKYQEAVISAKIAKASLSELVVGKPLRIKQGLILKTHSKTIPLEADLQLVKSPDGSIYVSTTTPILLDVKQLELNKGVEKLIEVMSLASINQQIPITFYGRFIES